MSVEDARYAYLFAAANAVFTCNGSRRYRSERWLAVDAASIRLDLLTAEQHRVTGGPHPRLLGLTDGAALAAYEGIGWA